MKELEREVLEQARKSIKAINKMKKEFYPRTKEINAEYHNCENIFKQANAIIERAEDDKLKQIMKAYYLQGRSWTDIGDDVYMHRTTCQKLVEKYFEGSKQDV